MELKRALKRLLIYNSQNIFSLDIISELLQCEKSVK